MHLFSETAFALNSFYHSIILFWNGKKLKFKSFNICTCLNENKVVYFFYIFCIRHVSRNKKSAHFEKNALA